MDKRYQVFVSSTFADLQDERQEVMQALLELDCIPSGMELFPAANEDQWTLIKEVIDDCDYYLVIVAGRYGSLGPDGLSYTEMEYRYALDQGKPVIGFVHRNPGGIVANRTESSEEGKERLSAFRKLVQQKMCRQWDTAADLGSQVSRSLVKLIRSTPAIGWVRADQVPEEGTAEEILRLRKRLEEAESRLDSVRTEAPSGSERLSQGSELFKLRYSFKAHPEGMSWGGEDWSAEAKFSWDDVFAVLSPLLIEAASEAQLKAALDRFLQQEQDGVLRTDNKLTSKNLVGFLVNEEDFQTIKVQFRALGLIAKSTKPRSVRDTATYWTLTPYGDTHMTKLRAIPRSSSAE